MDSQLATSGLNFTGVFQIANIIIILVVVLGCSMYAFVLFVKFTRRGIIALDIYIKNSRKNIE